MRDPRSTAPSPPPRRRRRYAARVRSAVPLALVALLLTAPLAAADGGIDIRSSSRYVLQPAKDRVQATMTITVRNQRPSVRTGSSLQYFYLPSFQVPVPADAEQLTATSGGSPLAVSRRRTSDPSTAVATVRFPSDLLYGQSRTIVVHFVLRGEKPRSTDQTRVGPGYATFAVYGPGDPGQVSVTVVVPSSMEFDATTDLFSHEATGATVTYTATENTEASGLWAVVSARDPAIARTGEVTLGGQRVTLTAYQDDPQWLSFVSARMTAGVPVLARLIATPWPGGLTTVREDRAVTVRGYDGWFDSSADEIVIGEALDEELLFHELSHAWATPDTLTQRWLYEGVAQTLAAEAVTALGGTPQKMTPVSRTSHAAIALNSWHEDNGRAQSADDYGYPASYRVVSDLLQGMSADTRSTVLAAAIGGRSAYAAPGEPALKASFSDWQRVLDLVQVVGHQEGAPATYATWVLTPAQRAQLGPRASALAAYRALDAADGDLLPPLGLRRSMTNWDFATAQRAITALRDAGPAAVALEQAAARNHVRLPPAVAALYQGADGFTAYADLPGTLTRARATLEAVGAADRAAAASRNPLARLGSLALDVDGKASRADAAFARADLAGAARSAADASSATRWLTWVGLVLLLGGLLVVAGGVLAARWVGSRRRGRRAAREARAVPVAVASLDLDGATAQEPDGAGSRSDD